MKINKSIAIPFYNEQDTVKTVLMDLSKEMSKKWNDYEIIAVDNASSDNTPKIIKSLSKSNNKIKYVYISKKGYGNAIIGGLKHCKGEYLGYGWGDGQMDAKDVVTVFDTIEKEDLDLCKVKRINRKDNFYRKLQSMTYNMLYRIIFPYIKFDLFGDMNGCPKIMTTDAYNKLKISSKQWFIDTEVMIKSNKYKLKIKEIPINFKKRSGGKSNLKPSVVFEFLKEAIKYKLNGY